MTPTVEYIITFAPALVAFFCEVGILGWAQKAFKQMKNTNEYKELAQQNKQLLQALKESQQLNREYLTKLDHVRRETPNDKRNKKL